MKTIMLSIMLCLFGFAAAQAQVGQAFPELSAETIKGKKVRLPAAGKGKFTLLGLAFSNKSDQALQSWFSPVYTRFMADRSNAGIFADFAYDVNVFFVPMFTGANKMAAGPARQKMLRELDTDLHKHVLLYVGELAPYQQQLSMLRQDEPYFFVLNEQGTIVYATSGAYSEQKMDEVEEILSAEE